MFQEIPEDILQALQNVIHYEFGQVKLLIQAITHTSYANEHGGEHNERLEFLGDAVLELAISHELFQRFPHAQEGHLTKMRSSLVSEAALSGMAKKIGLGQYLFLGKGEENQGGRDKNSMLSDGLEAILGAIFLDGGLEAVSQCVKFLYQDNWPLPPETFRPRDSKSRLQELTQRVWKTRPTYTLLGSFGPEHAKQYKIGLTLPDNTQVEWTESSVRKAEQGAAAQAIILLQAKIFEEAESIDQGEN
ncbi:MAG: ribonuclease III [Desulfomicrobium sp.]|jgi:ribonuclease-3|nr:ribonuclease III [Desulfomicrobium sp.]NLV95976.1 ribonuclease III [Desulfovibrionales bacterium]